MNGETQNPLVEVGSDVLIDRIYPYVAEVAPEFDELLRRMVLDRFRLMQERRRSASLAFFERIRNEAA